MKTLTVNNTTYQVQKEINFDGVQQFKLSGKRGARFVLTIRDGSFRLVSVTKGLVAKGDAKEL